jgi:hypothetical protein
MFMFKTYSVESELHNPTALMEQMIHCCHITFQHLTQYPAQFRFRGDMSPTDIDALTARELIQWY